MQRRIDPRDAHDVGAGLKQGLLLGLALALLVLPPAGVATRGADAAVPPHRPPVVAALAPPRLADLGGRTASDDARSVANWVAASRDNRGMPFVILDKRDARVYAFAPDARLLNESPVLLGAAPGDDSVPDIGTRPMSLVKQDEKTTPAGRFISQPGRNATGEDVIWVDYHAAVSMHRVRPVDPKERRLERLASDDPTQRRISYGCINVPVAFFEGVLQPLMGGGRGVVYVLPERKALGEVFAGTVPVQREVRVSSAAP